LQCLGRLLPGEKGKENGSLGKGVPPPNGAMGHEDLHKFAANGGTW